MYFYIPDLPDKFTSFQLKEQAAKFIAASTLPALAGFLETELDTLKELAAKPSYQQFYIPKPNGEKRLIENPAPPLKGLLRRLAFFFQAVYHTVRPACAFGSILSTAEEVLPRNVYTNALRHVGQKWLFNLDIQQFFPSISRARLYALFKEPPFAFNPKAAACLADLCSHEDHLPMGAPTSPILANLVCLGLDRRLEKLAQKNQWNYTRFIDDLSFSGPQKFKPAHQAAVREAIAAEGFAVNEEKVRLERIADEPEVTGLVLRADKPDVSEVFIRELEGNIKIYHTLTEPDMLHRGIFSAFTLRRFRNYLHGQLNFIKFVRGGDHKSYRKLRQKLYPRAW